MRTNENGGSDAMATLIVIIKRNLDVKETPLDCEEQCDTNRIQNYDDVISTIAFQQLSLLTIIVIIFSSRLSLLTIIAIIFSL